MKPDEQGKGHSKIVRPLLANVKLVLVPYFSEKFSRNTTRKRYSVDVRYRFAVKNAKNENLIELKKSFFYLLCFYTCLQTVHNRLSGFP